MLLERRSLLALLAGLIACCAMSLNAQESDADEDDEEVEEEDPRRRNVEEMIVTGSHIRRDNFDLPSPMDVIGELDLQMSGTPDLGDVIFDQTYQIGVNANTNTSEIGGADDQGTGEGWNQSVNRPDGPQGGETYANLRGVGTRATMTLMDGHRVPTNVNGYGANTRRAGADLTNLYPTIAVHRVDNILDGASALYGAEAVSGVVNIVPRKNFDGLMINYEFQQALEDGAPYRNVGLLAGSQGDRTSAIFALEIRDADNMPFTSRPDYIINSAGWTGQLLPTYGERGNGLPGDWRVPLRNVDGELYLPEDTNPFWYEANAQHSTALGADIHEVYRNINNLNEDNIPSLLDKSGALIPQAGALPWSSSWRYPQYPRDFSDNAGSFRTLHLEDPGCNNDFGAGHNSLGPAPDPATLQEPYTTNTLGYNDTTKDGNFLNGFRTGPWRGQETRSRGTETNQAFGSDCRYTITDITDIRERRDQEQGMAYFEHQFNDYVTLRGEAVFSRLDYSTRTFAPSIDEWPTGVRRYDHTQPIAIGSLPGNPFRAYADDSNVCDVAQVAAQIAACANYVPAHIRDERDTQAAEDWGYVLTGPILVSHGTLDWQDVDGDGRYDYLQEPGEWLVFAQDMNGDGLPDRDFNGDGVADDAELADRSGQLNPLHRVVLLSMTEDRDGDGVPDRFDPDMDGIDSDGDGVLDTFTSGGIRLFDDVLMGDSGVGIHGYIGAFPKQPYVHESYPWLNKDMSLDDRRLSENLRLRLGTTVNIPDTEWLVDADWIWNNSRREWVSLDPAWPLTVDSLRCQGGPNGDSCWNPFSTAWLSQDPATGLVLPAEHQSWRSKDDPAWNTAIETRNAGLSPRHVQRDVGMVMLDLSLSNGQLFDLWYNQTPVGIAVGIHMRTEDEEFRPDQLGAAGISSDRVDFQGTSEEVRAGFVEMRFQPISSEVLGQMEVQAAVRYTEFDINASFASVGQSAGFDVTIPKLAIRYQPTDWLAVRGSITEGFVPPGSYQLFASAPGDVVFSTQSDYICDAMPELAQCEGSLGASGGIPGVAVRENASNRGLDAEISDLWNAGFSLLLLDGDLVFDADYTNVVFNGRVERMGAGVILGQNAGPFELWALERCPGTLIDYDNEDEANISIEQFVDQTRPSELQCRADAARSYIANQEQGLGGATILRDANGRLSGVDEGWLNQGESRVRSIVYNMRYRFDASEIPFVDFDAGLGSFEFRVSATQMLEMSLQRYSEDSGHQFAGIRVDGLGNRNSAAFWRPYNALFSPLPPTPKWRVNASLRWFRDNHTAHFGMRWHQSITDLIASWDEIVERYGPPHSAGNPYLSHDHGMDTTSWTEDDACTDQDRNPYCRIESRAYFDVSYTYRQPDFFGFGYVAANVAIRNVFNSNPNAFPSGVGYESYLDSIMGRQLYLRMTVGF